jgi:hypothetical protein
MYQHHGHKRLDAVSDIQSLRVTVGGLRPDGVTFDLDDAATNTFVHGMLRLARVPVSNDPDAPRLHTSIAVTRVLDLYSVSISVELWDRVWLTRQTNGEPLEVPTWRQMVSMVTNRHELRENVRQQLGHLMTHFLNDYVAANHQRVHAQAG